MTLSTQQVLIEQAEVVLSNLIALNHSIENGFLVPHDDVVVSIATAISLLRKAQDQYL